MIDTYISTVASTELSAVEEREITGITSEISNVAIFYSIADSIVGQGCDAINGTLNTKVGSVRFAAIETAGVSVDIFSFADQLISSPETDFQSYEISSIIPEEVTQIYNHYGEITRMILIEVGNSGFLSLGNILLALKKSR